MGKNVKERKSGIIVGNIKKDVKIQSHNLETLEVLRALEIL